MGLGELSVGRGEEGAAGRALVTKTNMTARMISRGGCGALDAPQLPGQEQEGLNVRIAGSRAPKADDGAQRRRRGPAPGAGEAGIGA